MSNASKNTLIIAFMIFLLLNGGMLYVRMIMLAPELAKMEKTVKASDKTIEDLNEEMEGLIALEGRQDEIKVIEERVKEKAKRLPEESQIPELILNIRKMLIFTGVHVVSANKGTYVRREYYTEIPYTLKCVTNFHNFGQFLNLIEVNPDRLMRVKKFKIENNDKRPHKHEIEITLAAYVNRKKS